MLGQCLALSDSLNCLLSRANLLSLEGVFVPFSMFMSAGLKQFSLEVFVN